MGTRRFPYACISTPHHLASSAGLAELANGGNAVDAALCANLVLAVVAPYHCGVGGDLAAIVWDGRAHAYAGAGRAPAAATGARIRDEVGDEMPWLGPFTVTVPGAVQGWFDLLERFGTRSFGDLASRAIGYAQDGFVVSDEAMDFVAPAQEMLKDFGAWRAVYREVAAGKVLRQPALGRTLRTLADHGPDAFYRGPIAADIAATLHARHGVMTEADLAAHRGEWVAPLAVGYRDVEVFELPPPNQGVTAATALSVLDALGPLPDDPGERTHFQVEAVKAALADRAEHLADPAHMTVPPQRLLGERRIKKIAAALDPRQASPWPGGRGADGGTAYLCVADADGMLVSLMQSNFRGFGSGVHVPEWGINLHDRGALFSLEAGHPNEIGPSKLPLHTLIPSLVLRAGEPWLVFGTMGGDGQAQTQVQLLGLMVDDGVAPRPALDAPRWVVSPTDGTVVVEGRTSTEGIVKGLERRGHAVEVVGAREHLMGHAQVIQVGTHGFAAASDPRTEGAALGC